MHSIRNDMREFQGQLRKGVIQKAYRALLSYMMDLRTHFKKTYPDYAVSALYQGYMDMTYFAIFPPPLRQRGLKIAIVFNYEEFRFEAWLAGRNRKINRQYRELFGDTPRSIDAIVECDLVKDFDFSDSDALTSSVEMATVAFIDDIERFLSKRQGARSGSATA